MIKQHGKTTTHHGKRHSTTSRKHPRREQPARLPPIDRKGRRVRVGDWVRLVAIPPAVRRSPRETRAVFAKALGKTFKVEAFGRYGHAELDLSKKVARLNWIWVEPEYLERSRRAQKRAPL